ncbi:hypothetical protein M885DRAFT_520336 [Pelagophyceae sp. CCMP2097]|nr:hypothetical protein M885DRAFT_520336 [Pelagophyceae sp. CCMP2097]
MEYPPRAQALSRPPPRLNIQVRLKGDEWREFSSQSDAARYYNISQAHFSLLLHGKSSSEMMQLFEVKRPDPAARGAARGAAARGAAPWPPLVTPPELARYADWRGDAAADRKRPAPAAGDADDVAVRGPRQRHDRPPVARAPAAPAPHAAPAAPAAPAAADGAAVCARPRVDRPRPRQSRDGRAPAEKAISAFHPWSNFYNETHFSKEVSAPRRRGAGAWPDAHGGAASPRRAKHRSRAADAGAQLAVSVWLTSAPDSATGGEAPPEDRASKTPDDEPSRSSAARLASPALDGAQLAVSAWLTRTPDATAGGEAPPEDRPAQDPDEVPCRSSAARPASSPPAREMPRTEATRQLVVSAWLTRVPDTATGGEAPPEDRAAQAPDEEPCRSSAARPASSPPAGEMPRTEATRQLVVSAWLTRVPDTATGGEAPPEDRAAKAPDDEPRHQSPHSPAARPTSPPPAREVPQTEAPRRQRAPRARPPMPLQAEATSPTTASSRRGRSATSEATAAVPAPAPAPAAAAAAPKRKRAPRKKPPPRAIEPEAADLFMPVPSFRGRACALMMPGPMCASSRGSSWAGAAVDAPPRCASPVFFAMPPPALAERPPSERAPARPALAPAPWPAPPSMAPPALAPLVAALAAQHYHRSLAQWASMQCFYGAGPPPNAPMPASCYAPALLQPASSCYDAMRWYAAAPRDTRAAAPPAQYATAPNGWWPRAPAANAGPQPPGRML